MQSSRKSFSKIALGLSIILLVYICLIDARSGSHSKSSFHSRLRQTADVHLEEKSKSPIIEIDLPDNFGKTNFILGAPTQELLQSQKKQSQTSPVITDDGSFNLVCDGCVKQIFFAPDDTVQKVLIYLINHEQSSIKLAAFAFTDKDVALALLDARDRGVRIEIIADPGCVRDRFGKIPMLQQKGLDVFIYNPNYKKEAIKGFLVSIMHHKFIIFGKNILDKKLIWTGSFNFTRSAYRHNQENVLLLDDIAIIKKYTDQFDVLKQRSHVSKKLKKDDTVLVAMKNKKQQKVNHRNCAAVV